MRCCFSSPRASPFALSGSTIIAMVGCAGAGTSKRRMVSSVTIFQRRSRIWTTLSALSHLVLAVFLSESLVGSSRWNCRIKRARVGRIPAQRWWHSATMSLFLGKHRYREFVCTYRGSPSKCIADANAGLRGPSFSKAIWLNSHRLSAARALRRFSGSRRPPRAMRRPAHMLNSGEALQNGRRSSPRRAYEGRQDQIAPLRQGDRDRLSPVHDA